MKLVFIHGWGLTPQIWDGVSELLPEFMQERIDLGYFGNVTPNLFDDEPAILIGHSLGFVHGMKMRDDWQGWISINSFPRFVKTDDKPGCVSSAELRDITLRLRKDPQKTLHDFHAFIGAITQAGTLNADTLRDGLNELRDSDVAATAAHSAPGLVLASRNDPLVPITASEALAIGKAIMWSDTGGHMLPQNDPAFCAAAIRQFVEMLNEKKHYARA